MPTADLLFWGLAILATFLVGASKGGVPGVGILAVPLLSQVISPVVAAGLLLPLYCISDWYGLWLYRKNYDVWNIKIMTFASTIGICIGWATARYNSDELVKLMVGLIGIWYTIDLVLKSRRTVVEPKPADVPRGLFWGTICGFVSFVAHAGGTPFQMYVLPQRLEKMVYAGTATITFTFVNALKLPPYWMLGQINLQSLETCAWLLPVALFGAWAGFRLTKILPERIFFRAVETALFLVSVKLIYDAVSHWLA
ncbi:sulfite exporter TauE/SafE family protein [Aestuariivirga sp.]|uniref:sulfite exporter TauE/SafE family protein n=1 Tax=Aestuariivirga sp. TaxID=2650926 RepID=UPI0039E4AA68